MPKAFLIDTTRCTACRGCQLACKDWHNLPANKTKQTGSHQNPPDLNPYNYKIVSFHDYMDEIVYANSPVHFLRNLAPDHYYNKLYRQSQIICCVGQGAWENDLLAGTRELDAVLKEKNIPAWIDYWGKDVSHDWVWWQRQIVYFFDKILPWK